MTTRFLIALIITAGLAAACSQEQQPIEKQLASLRAERAAIDEQIRTLERANDGAALTGVPVTVHVPSMAPFQHVLDVKGTVDSRTTVIITPKMAGQITKIAVTNGQAVAKGQLLVELDNAMTKAGIDEVQTQLDFATTLYDKQRRIYEQKAGSEVQYLSAKTQKESLERRMASLKEQLELSRLYAPVSGIVDNLVPKVGESAMPGMPMMTIVNTADMRVVADLAETYVSDVQVGDNVTLVFPETGDTVRSKVMIAARNVNAVNRTFRVEIPIRPVPPTLRTNMTASVIINDRTIDNAITVPLAAIVREGPVSFVYVVNDKDIVDRREVTTGLVSGAMVQIMAGLQAAERVVVRGVLDIAQGQRVRVIQ